MLAFLLAFKLLCGMLVDHLFGEIRNGHPLPAFGRLATRIESTVPTALRTRITGLLAWALAVLPWVGLAVLLQRLVPASRFFIDVGLLYFALGARSLAEHAQAVAEPLAAGDLAEARQKLSRMVSRETDNLDANGVAKAACESVLENGNDAVFGTIFWFCLFGGPGALLFRLANTLDAMWGYRTPRYLRFGWAAARIDDLLNWIPARLTALSYAALGDWRTACACWRKQAPHWDSPNAGAVMAAGAGALGVQLGGSAIYHGHEEQRPLLGYGSPPQAETVIKAIRLVQHGMLLWLLLISVWIYAMAFSWHGI